LHDPKRTGRVAFAKRAIPTPARPALARFQSGDRPTMVFDPEIHLENDALRELRLLWDELYA
jgi:hypothetical protein